MNKNNKYDFSRCINALLIFSFLLLYSVLIHLLVVNYFDDGILVSAYSDFVVAIPAVICAIAANSLTKKKDEIQKLLRRPKLEINNAQLSLELCDDTKNKNLYYSGEKAYLRKIKELLMNQNGSDRVPARGFINISLNISPKSEVWLENIQLKRVGLRFDCVDNQQSQIYYFKPTDSVLELKQLMYEAKKSERVVGWNDFLNNSEFVIRTDLYPDEKTIESDWFWRKLTNFFDVSRSKDLSINYLETIVEIEIKYETNTKYENAKILIYYNRGVCRSEDGSLLNIQIDKGRFLYDEKAEVSA